MNILWPKSINGTKVSWKRLKLCISPELESRSDVEIYWNNIEILVSSLL